MPTYTAAELHALRRYDVTPPRPARKAIFSLRLWRPRFQRMRVQHCQHNSGIPRRHSIDVNGLRLGCINARSIANKRAILSQAIVDNQLDVLVITESWNECSESVVLKTVTPPGYQCVDAARPLAADTNLHTDRLQNHGGLAIVHRDGFKLTKKFLKPTKTFEYLCTQAAVGSNRFILLGVYRPGSQAVTTAFFDELATVLEQISTHRCPIVICGDFNIHVDECEDVHAVQLAQLLESFGCIQHVDRPTHKAGHTLDLVIARQETKITNIHVGDMLSDHALVTFTLDVKKPG